jgi:hypothetical protein
MRTLALLVVLVISLPCLGQDQHLRPDIRARLKELRSTLTDAENALIDVQLRGGQVGSTHIKSLKKGTLAYIERPWYVDRIIDRAAMVVHGLTGPEYGDSSKLRADRTAVIMEGVEAPEREGEWLRPVLSGMFAIEANITYKEDGLDKVKLVARKINPSPNFEEAMLLAQPPKKRKR